MTKNDYIKNAIVRLDELAEDGDAVEVFKVLAEDTFAELNLKHLNARTVARSLLAIHSVSPRDTILLLALLAQVERPLREIAAAYAVSPDTLFRVLKRWKAVPWITALAEIRASLSRRHKRGERGIIGGMGKC